MVSPAFMPVCFTKIKALSHLARSFNPAQPKDDENLSTAHQISRETVVGNVYRHLHAYRASGNAPCLKLYENSQIASSLAARRASARFDICKQWSEEKAKELDKGALSQFLNKQSQYLSVYFEIQVSSGRLIVKVLPFPVSLSTFISPLCFFMIM